MLTFPGQTSSESFRQLLLNLGCTLETDPINKDMVWAFGPRKDIAAFQKNTAIPRWQAARIMVRLDVFDDFLTRIGYRINRL